jgi:hypothetical protein
MVNCPVCRSQNMETAKFCGSCGQPFSRQPEPVSTVVNCAQGHIYSAVYNHCPYCPQPQMMPVAETIKDTATAFELTVSRERTGSRELITRFGDEESIIAEGAGAIVEAVQGQLEQRNQFDQRRAPSATLPPVSTIMNGDAGVNTMANGHSNNNPISQRLASVNSRTLSGYDETGRPTPPDPDPQNGNGIGQPGAPVRGGQTGRLNLSDPGMRPAAPVPPSHPASHPAPFASPNDGVSTDGADRRTIVVPEQVGSGRTSRGKIVGWLISYTTNPDGEDFRIYAGHNRIGANPVCDIVISDETVSGSHAILVYREGRCLIKDDLSRNGTFVNGREITEAHPLQNYDQVRLGNTYLTFISALRI